jgi:hypothetical protein
MKAAVQQTHGTRGVVERQQRLARVTGLLYLVLVVFGMFAPIVLETLVIPGDAAATADSILGAQPVFVSSLIAWLVIVVVVAVTFYLLLEPVSRALSLVAAAFRVVYAAILGAFLLNLYDAFRLLTGTGSGASLGAEQRQTMALSSLDTFSPAFSWRWCSSACT